MDSPTRFTLTEHSAAFWRVTFDNPPVNLVTQRPESEFKDQMTAFWAAVNRPAQQYIARHLFEAGLQQRSDVERDLPHWVTRFPHRPGSSGGEQTTA